jgi:hypothetical protein
VLADWGGGGAGGEPVSMTNEMRSSLLLLVRCWKEDVRRMYRDEKLACNLKLSSWKKSPFHQFPTLWTEVQNSFVELVL